MNLTIDVNVNFPGLMAIFATLKGPIMDKLQELQASTDALVAKVEEGNNKVDALIVVANTTKDALVALQQSAASGVTISAGDIDAIISKQNAAIESITAQEAQTDAASTAVAP